VLNRCGFESDIAADPPIRTGEAGAATGDTY
jgi:hypothetical protein